MSILQASSDGNLPLLKSLKDDREDINIKDEDGNNALLKACYGTGNTDTVRWLLCQGLSPEYKNKEGYNAFLLAAEFGHLSVLKFLKEKNVNIKVTGPAGQNALHVACIGKGEVNTIKWLVDQGFSPEHKTNDGYNAFILAAEKGHLSVLKFFKEINVDIKVTGPVRYNALHAACFSTGGIETIKWLVDQGFSPEHKLDDGNNAFLLAAQKGHLPVLKFFKDINVDIKVTGPAGQNALHVACIGTGEINTIKWLVDQGFSPEHKTNDGYNAFILAAQKGHLSVLKFFKELNVDIKVTGPVGYNALHAACYDTGGIETIKWLLDQGFSPEYKLDDGNNALLLAALKGHLLVLKFFKEINVDIRITGPARNNALHTACIGTGDINTIKWLLEQGFSIETPNSDGKTAFYLAVMRGHAQLIRLFMLMIPTILNKTAENG